jgi:hypothetical protein
MRYYKNSTGIVYDLISEGPISLVNGLNSIYLNRRPIANASVGRAALGGPAQIFLNSNGSSIRLGEQRLGIDTYVPILIKKAGKQSTTSVIAGSSTITATSFFASNMLASNSAGDGGLYQKVRIPGAGVGGTEYEGEILSISGTTATMDTPISTTISGPVYWDHFSFGLEINTSGTYTISLLEAAPNSAFWNANFTPPSTNWTSVEAIIGAGSQGINANNTGLNFKDVKVNFRNGVADQPPAVNTTGFSSASYGINLNAELTQVTNAIQEDGTSIPIYNNKTNPWWTTDSIGGVQPESGGSVFVINTGSGANGLNIGSPSEVDEVVITINASEGLYGIKENEDQSKTDAGAVFQIFLKYKVNAAATYQKKLILGPTQETLTSSTGYFVHNQGALSNGGNPTGVLKARVDSAVNFDFRINLQEFKPFDNFEIEIYKITPDRFKVGKWTYFQKTIVTSVQAYVHDKLSYPHSAYAAIEFDSQEFQGNIPERSYHCYGVDMDLPVNYITREESANGVANYNRSGGVDTGVYQVWNGTFRRGYSNNPVWNLREILLNNRWGLGNWLTADQINKYSFYSLARYCDELVPDGRGGLEPRFTCGVYLTQSTEAYKVIKDFATTMLALPYWVDGEFILEGDRPAEPVYTFTKGNIEGGIFSYEGTGNRTRTNQIAVTFNDKDNFYEQSVELIDDIDNIVSTNRLITEEVVAFGATTRSQAIRYGKWKLLTAKLQKELVSFKTGENAGYLKPGSVINIQDADRDRVRYSGRVVSATTTTVTIDKPVTLAGGTTYQLHVFVAGSATYLLQETATIGGIVYNYGDIIPVYTEAQAEVLRDDSNNAVNVQFSPDSHLQTRTITSSEGPVLTVEEFTVAPESEVIWAITAKINGDTVEGSPKMYRVLGIGEDNNSYTITAVEHFNAKFDIIDEDYLSDPPEYVRRYTEIPPVTNFTATLQFNSEGISEANSSITADIMLSWNPPLENGTIYSDFNKYEIKYTRPDGSFTIIDVPKDSIYYELKNVPEGLHNFSIQAVSSTGPVSVAKISSIVVSKDNFVPGVFKQASLLKGGTFNKPITFSEGILTAPSSFRFTAESGLSVIFSETAPRVIPGMYWSNGSGVFLWDGNNWVTISGTFPSGVNAVLGSFTVSASGTVA